MLFAAILFVACVGFLEAVSFLLYRAVVGEWFSYGAAAELQASVIAATSDDDVRDDAAMTDDQRAAAMNAMCRTAHPYLGYVYTPDMNQGRFANYYAKEHGGLGVTPFGFVDSDIPVRRKNPGRFIVAVVGGSVALGFGAHGTTAFSAELQKHPSLRDRKIEYVRLALGGYKQPQQLLTLAYLLSLGAQFDLVVNIDGFNEIALAPLENVPAGVFPYFPRAWHFIAGNALTRRQQILVGRSAAKTEDRRTLASGIRASGLRWSVTVQLAWRLRDRALAAEVNEIERALREADVGDSFVATGPGVEHDAANLHIHLAAHWRRSSVQLHRLCQENGIRYLHFLQPNQYVATSKPIGEVERRQAVDAESPYAVQVQAGYPRLLAEGRRLRATGVDFHDLTGIFRDHEEALYVDTCCHFNTRGQELLAQAIGAAVRASLDQEPGPMRRATSLAQGRVGSHGYTPALELVRSSDGLRFLIRDCRAGSSGSLRIVAAAPGRDAAPSVTSLQAENAAMSLPFTCEGVEGIAGSGWASVAVPQSAASTIYVQGIVNDDAADSGLALSNVLRVDLRPR